VLQFTFLTGKMAGSQHEARHFPFIIGRSPSAQCRVEEEGVWDQHLRIELTSEAGCTLTVHEQALASVNGEPVKQAALRNGDIISMGATQLRFLLSPTRQRSLRIREWLTWVSLGGLCFAQIALIYWLLAGSD
jgi:hypothetical protein